MPHAKDRKPRTRQRIVLHAQRLFRARGYADTTIDAIMQACGLTRGGFYLHFANKAQLYAEAIGGELKAACVPTCASALQALLDALAKPDGADFLWLPLARDVGSKHGAVREAYARLFEQLAGSVNGNAVDDAALAHAAMALGALVVAHSIDDAGLTQRVVEAVRTQSTASADDAAAPVYFWSIDAREARRVCAAAAALH